MVIISTVVSLFYTTYCVCLYDLRDIAKSSEIWRHLSTQHLDLIMNVTYVHVNTLLDG